MVSVAFHSSQSCIVLEVTYNVLCQCSVQSLPASLVGIAICDVSYIVRSFTHTVYTNIVFFIDVMSCSMVWRYQEPASSCGWRWQFPPKCWYLSTTLHGGTSQETVVLIPGIVKGSHLM